MTSRQTGKNDRELDREIERYRRAALEALSQLEWCIDFLYSQRKAQIARALACNRRQIIDRAGF